ncbi:MAG: hypothetical protein QM803_16555 [Rhodocyclaceae bacterium]
MSLSMLFGERSLTIVAALFDNLESARRAAEHVRSASSMQAGQVKLVAPADPAFDAKLEPEQTGIAHTLIRTHIVLGAVGLVAGVLLAVVLQRADLALFAQSPGRSLFVLALLGLFFGMMVGGFVSLRPDHDMVIEKVRWGSASGRWAVVTHPVSSVQKKQAEDVLRAEHGELVESL